MSKPDWKDAPEWAQFRAMDSDGMWFWHEKEPEPRSRDWASNGMIREARGTRTDWRTTMEPRP